MNIQNLINNFRTKYYLPNLIEEIGTKNLSQNELVKIVRPITKSEVSRLSNQGNTCSDWTSVYVEPDFDTGFIFNNTFEGLIFLGKYSGKEIEIYPGLKMNNGIYNSYLNDVYIDSNALVRNNKLISRYYISENAIVFGNNIIYANKKTKFGNGCQISVGSEVGGRDLILYAEQDLNNLNELITGNREKDCYEKYNQLIDSYVDNVESDYGIICTNAKVTNNMKVTNSMIGSYAVIDNTTLIKDSTILSSKEETTSISDGVILDTALCQWGVKVKTGAIVSKSLLTEHSGVERHAKVNESIIGPNSIIGEGEVTASIIGPFVGFHHQSMLIASLWFNGRGNVGYGANIGSNHTSKLPDQEHLCGEGMFYGLGCNIKFPANYSNSPYSIIATGVTTLPQKVNLPFSLISTPFKQYQDVSPAYNEILPAWVLSDNSYMIFRNEDKFIKRNRAQRTEYDFRIFREEIMEKIFIASESLKSLSGKEFYTDRDNLDIGKNILTESNRLKAIKTYDFYLKYYLFREMYLENSNNLLDNLVEFFEITELAKDDIRKQYKKMFNEILDSVIESKSKDSVRGSKIIDDYAHWHSDLEEDETIINLTNSLKSI